MSDAHDVDAPEPVTTELLDRLAELAGCEYATYVRLDWGRRVVTGYVACSYEAEAEFTVDGYVVSTGFWTGDGTDPRWRGNDPSFDKWSDRMDRRERERLRDQEGYNAEFRVVDRIVFPISDPRSPSATLALDSQGRDFEERDRQFVLTLRPHAIASWRRAESRTRAARLLEVLAEDGDSGRGQAIVLHTADCRIEHATSAARRLLADWFGSDNGRLPSEVEAWIAGARPGDSHTTYRNGSALTVEAAADRILTVREHSIESAALTPRERQVLGLVADGLTNNEIAQRLFVTESTVAKHLAQAYPKLGVHSRTAAVARLRTHT